MTRRQLEIEARRLLRKNFYGRAARVFDLLLREEPDDHFLLVKRGVCDHERRRYESALAWFRKAESAAPTCPIVLYNIANTMFARDRDGEARPLLEQLSVRKVRELAQACPDGDFRPRELLADVQFLLCKTVLALGAGWRIAERHLRRHMMLRRGVRSLFSLKTVRKEIRELEATYPGREKRTRRARGSSRALS